MPDATERKALVFCALVSACISCGPREWVSAGALFVTSVILFLVHRWITVREDAVIRLLDGWVPPPGAQAVAVDPAEAPSAEAAEAGSS
jgi:hypothetical protein